MTDEQLMKYLNSTGANVIGEATVSASGGGNKTGAGATGNSTTGYGDQYSKDPMFFPLHGEETPEYEEHVSAPEGRKYSELVQKGERLSNNGEGLLPMTKKPYYAIKNHDNRDANVGGYPVNLRPGVIGKVHFITKTSTYLSGNQLSVSIVNKSFNPFNEPVSFSSVATVYNQFSEPILSRNLSTYLDKTGGKQYFVEPGWGGGTANFLLPELSNYPNSGQGLAFRIEIKTTATVTSSGGRYVLTYPSIELINYGFNSFEIWIGK